MSSQENPQEVVAMSEEVRAYVREQIAQTLNGYPMEGFKIFAVEDEFMPEYNRVGDSGFDLRANIPSSITLQPGERATIPVGLYTEMPIGFEMQIRPRSGRASKEGATVVNAPGTIDAAYRGEIAVVFLNTDLRNAIVINRGDRIAQGVVCRVERINWERVSSPDQLEESVRGAQGFGSSGVQ